MRTADGSPSAAAEWRHLPILLLFLLAVPRGVGCAPAGQEGGGYDVVSVTRSGSLLSAQLELAGETASTAALGPDVQRLRLTASLQTDSRLHVRITDADHPRWEVPHDVIPRPTPEDAFLDAPRPGSRVLSAMASDLTFTIHASPFRFTVCRVSTGDILFDTRPRLVFKDRYLELTSALPADRASLYGLGEHTKRTFRLQHNDTFTLWNSDIQASYMDVNLYGSQPFYMDVRSPPAGAAHGVLLLNSNGMDVLYGGSYITYKVIGGVLDFYFFAGPSPLSVVDQYTQLVGRPAPMPYWSFGFHRCRLGYKDVADLEREVAAYATASIPLEVMWTDIDHMDKFKDFTLDPVNFPASRLRPFVDRLHRNGQKYVVILDPAISVNATYGTFIRGTQEDVFLKRNGTNYNGKGFPDGDVNFPDFMNPRAAEFWAREISLFRRTIPVDGLWIDMNEISSFSDPAPLNALDDPPYRINNAGVRRPINNRTVPASAVHHGGVTEYDAHNLYGLLESRATHRALLHDTGRRPFVLCRSTFVGSGRYGAHWTGDIWATWEDLRHSVNTMLSFGLFGIPMVGADICGFGGEATEELCRRWIQLGAFYPFAREHGGGVVEREPYRWESVATSARKSLGLRYRLLPYIYTLMYEAHTTGAPIARPLFFSYPDDAATYGVDRQFMLGRGVLVSPALEPNATTVNAYFPAGLWFSVHDHSLAVATRSGERVTLEALADTPNVHVAGGNILPLQQRALTTSRARRTAFHLLVALAEDRTATGDLFLDDGESPEMGTGTSEYSLVRFSSATGSDGVVTVRSQLVHDSYAPSRTLVIRKVVLMGIQSPAPSKKLAVYVNGVEMISSLESIGTWYRCSGGLGVAHVGGLSLIVGEEFELKVVMYSSLDKLNMH